MKGREVLLLAGLGVGGWLLFGKPGATAAGPFRPLTPAQYAAQGLTQWWQVARQFPDQATFTPYYLQYSAGTAADAAAVWRTAHT